MSIQWTKEEITVDLAEIAENSGGKQGVVVGLDPSSDAFTLTFPSGQRFRVTVQEIEGEQVDGQLALFDRDLAVTEEARP